MRLESAVNVYGVNVVLFAMCQVRAVMLPQRHSLVAVAVETLVFALGGYLLPCWILFLIEVQARQRFLAKCRGVASEDVGEMWAAHVVPVPEEPRS